MTRIKVSGGATTIFDGGAALPGEDVFAGPTEAAAVVAVEAWVLGGTFAPGDIRSHAGKLWRMIGGASHTALDANWQPSIAMSLWAETWPSGVIPEWRQPQGAHDAYPVGFTVTLNGVFWESLINANTTEPDTQAGLQYWQEVDANGDPVVSETEVWVSGETISFDPQNPARRTYEGVTYQLLQDPGINIWPPPTVPALWEAVV